MRWSHQKRFPPYSFGSFNFKSYYIECCYSLKGTKCPWHRRRSCLLLLSVYYLKTDITTATETSSGRDMEFFTLWRRRSGEHFQRTVLSSKIIPDHKCDCHYYALRDVLNGLPGTNNECIFR